MAGYRKSFRIDDLLEKKTGIKLNTLLMFELNYVAYGLLFGFRYDLYYGYKNGFV